MSGTALITRFQGPYCSGELLGDGFLLSDGVIVNRGYLVSGGQRITNGAALWANNNFLADSLVISNDDTLMSDAVDVSTQVVSLEGPVISDPLLQGSRSVLSTENYDGILLPGNVGV